MQKKKYSELLRVFVDCLNYPLTSLLNIKCLKNRFFPPTLAYGLNLTYSAMFSTLQWGYFLISFLVAWRHLSNGTSWPSCAKCTIMKFIVESRFFLFLCNLKLAHSTFVLISNMLRFKIRQSLRCKNKQWFCNYFSNIFSANRITFNEFIFMKMSDIKFCIFI